jgi:circadian clock protein KaiC
VRLLPAYIGVGTVYTGSARLAQETRERAEAVLEEQQLDNQRTQIAIKRHLLESQIAALRSELLTGHAEFERLTQQQKKRQQRLAQDQAAMGKIRGVTSADKAVAS